MIDTLEKAREDRIAELEYAFYEGVEKGIEMGIEKWKLAAAIKIIAELHLSVTEAMQVLTLPEDFRDELVIQLKKQQISYTL